MYNRNQILQPISYLNLQNRNLNLKIYKTYPAHLHIDLLPGTQGQGLGGRLLAHFEDHVRERGAPGVHLQTTNYNYKAVPFYSKHGYELAYETAIDHPLLEDLRLLAFVKPL